MDLADERLQFWRGIINALPDLECDSDTATTKTKVSDDLDLVYDNTGTKPRPYPMTVNALVTECGGMLLLQLQIALNAFCGLKESIDHCVPPARSAIRS